MVPVGQQAQALVPGIVARREVRDVTAVTEALARILQQHIPDLAGVAPRAAVKPALQGDIPGAREPVGAAFPDLLHPA